MSSQQYNSNTNTRYNDGEEQQQQLDAVNESMDHFEEDGDAQLRDLESKVNAAYEEVQQVRDRMDDELDEQREQIRDEQDKELAARERELLQRIQEEQREVLEAKCEVLERELRETVSNYSEKICILEDQNERLLADLQSKSRECVELHEAIEEFRAIATENQEARAKNNDRSKQLSEGYALMECELALSQEREQAASVRKNKYKKQVISYQKQVEQLVSKDQEQIVQIEGLMKQLEEQDAEIKKLSQLQYNYEQENMHNTAIVQELAAIQTQFISAKQEINELQERLMQTEVERNDLKERLSELEGENKLIQDHKEKIKQELEGNAHKMEQTVHSQMSQLQEAEQKIRDLNVLSERQQGQVNSLHKKLARTKDAQNGIMRDLMVLNTLMNTQQLQLQQYNLEAERENNEGNERYNQEEQERISKDQGKKKQQQLSSKDKQPERDTQNNVSSSVRRHKDSGKSNYSSSSISGNEGGDSSKEIQQLSRQLTYKMEALTKDYELVSKRLNKLNAHNSTLTQDKSLLNQELQQMKQRLNDKEQIVLKQKQLYVEETVQLKDNLQTREKQLNELNRIMMSQQQAAQAQPDIQGIAVKLVNYCAELHKKMASLTRIKNISWNIAQYYLEAAETVAGINSKLQERINLKGMVNSSSSSTKVADRQKHAAQRKHSAQVRLRRLARCVMFVCLLKVKKNTQFLLPQGVISNMLVQSCCSSRSFQPLSEFNEVFNNPDNVLLSLGASTDILSYKQSQYLFFTPALPRQLQTLQDTFQRASKADREQIDIINQKVKEISVKTQGFTESRNEILMQLQQQIYLNQSQGITIQNQQAEIADLQFEIKLNARRGQQQQQQQMGSSGKGQFQSQVFQGNNSRN